MDVRRFTADEARKELIASINAMDVDDLALALSEHGWLEDKVVVVWSPTVESYAYLNGMSSDARGKWDAEEAEHA
jgi:hypothetical protein